jgi:hypothetical protein
MSPLRIIEIIIVIIVIAANALASALIILGLSKFDTAERGLKISKFSGLSAIIYVAIKMFVFHHIM